MHTKASHFMKRSKIFLGVTTCLLAIAGVAAAKRYGSATTRYYCTAGNGGITKYCASTSSFDQLSTDITKPLATVTFTENSTSYTHLLYTAGTDAAGTTCGGTTNCVHSFHFDGTN